MGHCASIPHYLHFLLHFLQAWTSTSRLYLLDDAHGMSLHFDMSSDARSQSGDSDQSVCRFMVDTEDRLSFLLLTINYYFGITETV